MTTRRDYEDIEFMDYRPGELPDALPVEFWVSFDSCGEFLYASSAPPTPGGIAARYTLTTIRS